MTAASFQLLVFTAALQLCNGLVLRISNVSNGSSIAKVRTLAPADRLPHLPSEDKRWPWRQALWRESMRQPTDGFKEALQRVHGDDGTPDTFSWANITAPNVSQSFWTSLCAALNETNQTNRSSTNMSQALGNVSSANMSNTSNVSIHEMEFWMDFCSTPYEKDSVHFWAVSRGKRCASNTVDLPDVIAIRDCAAAVLKSQQCAGGIFDFWDNVNNVKPTCRCMTVGQTCLAEAPEAGSGEGGIYGVVARKV
mmetsp:Transcript_9189/g.20469  ORF Transcript_9189/g.20469 Transcript_9189/m.20469 type:complete len:252 (-) Transcript_9189:23-778(-)